MHIVGFILEMSIQVLNHQISYKFSFELGFRDGLEIAASTPLWFASGITCALFTKIRMTPVFNKIIKCKLPYLMVLVNFAGLGKKT